MIEYKCSYGQLARLDIAVAVSDTDADTIAARREQVSESETEE